MSGWGWFWLVVGVAVLYALAVLIQAVQMHFALKKRLRDAGVQFAEKRPKK